MSVRPLLLIESVKTFKLLFALLCFIFIIPSVRTVIVLSSPEITQKWKQRKRKTREKKLSQILKKYYNIHVLFIMKIYVCMCLCFLRSELFLWQLLCWHFYSCLCLSYLFVSDFSPHTSSPTQNYSCEVRRKVVNTR